jgi:hypothetical protein
MALPAMRARARGGVSPPTSTGCQRISMTARVGRAPADEQERDHRVRPDSTGAGPIPDQPGAGSHRFATSCIAGGLSRAGPAMRAFLLTGSSAARIDWLKADSHSRLHAEATAATLMPVQGNQGPDALTRSLLRPRELRNANAGFMQIIAPGE